MSTFRFALALPFVLIEMLSGRIAELIAGPDWDFTAPLSTLAPTPSTQGDE